MKPLVRDEFIPASEITKIASRYGFASGSWAESWRVNFNQILYGYFFFPKTVLFSPSRFSQVLRHEAGPLFVI